MPKKKKSEQRIRIDIYVHVKKKDKLMGRRARQDETGGWAKGMYMKGREAQEGVNVGDREIKSGGFMNAMSEYARNGKGKR
jgi:hypothetical protein